MNYPKIYNPSGNLLAVMDNIIEDTDTAYRKLNADFAFEFEAFEKELKSEYIIADNLVEFEGQRFEIKYIDDSHEIDDSIVISAECEHVSYRLISDDLTFYAFTGTPTEILTDLLSGTDFSVGAVDFSTPIIFLVNEETTKFRVVQLLAAKLGAEIDYTDLGFTINLLDSLGVDNGFEIRTGKNLRSIKRVIDNRGQLKTYYSVDMIELKNSDLYIENGFDVLEVVELGDTIKVIDPRMNINIQNKIISRTWNPIKSIVSKVELSNSIELLTDEMVAFEVNSVNKDESIYGVKINNTVGWVSERTDKFAKSVFNADEFAMKVGDGFGSYTDAVYFDPVTGKYKYIGDVDVSGKITGAEIIGSVINNGSGTFLVDALGNVIANSLTANNAIINGAISITSGSGIANLSDAGTLAVKNNVDFLNAGEILNAGGLAVKNSVNFLNAGEILNSGALAIKNAVDFLNSGEILNAGTLATKNAGSPLSAGLTILSNLRSEMLASSASAIPKKSNAKATG